MPKLIILVLLLIITFEKSNATNYHIPAGARANAMGKSGTALIDSWGTFNNQAATAYTTDFTLLAYCENRFGLKEFSAFQAAAVLPTPQGSFSANITYFGLDLYNEQKIGVGYARKFGHNFSLGLQFDLLGLSIPATGILEHNLTFEVGLIYKPSKEISVGIHIFNPTQTNLGPTENNTIVPQISQLGISYLMLNNFTLAAEMEHSSTTDLNIKMGAEYLFSKRLAIRTGYFSQPQTCTFGLGLNLSHIKIGLAYQFYNSRNKTPGISMVYKF